MKFAGLDIGGANIKFAKLDGETEEIPFPMWKQPERLVEVLKELASRFHPETKVGVTTTAELADCFASKPQGVSFVIDAVQKAMGDFEPLFYKSDGEMAEGSRASQQWRLVAAANWHAIAWMTFKMGKQNSGFLIDIGSTTIDVIPMADGKPITERQSDLDRLTNGQLLYAGVGRTPICSLLSEFKLGGKSVSAAREFFATTADAFRWLGLAECSSNSEGTADGRTKSKHDSGCRLARMVCADVDELGLENVTAIARQTRQKLSRMLAAQVSRVVGDHESLPTYFRVSGGGAWLAVEALGGLRESLASRTGDFMVDPYHADAAKSQCAAAFAVALRRKAYAFGESNA